MNDDNEYELLYMYRKGEQQALSMLMRMIQPFVIRIYSGLISRWPGYEIDEAMQAAWLGLLNAVCYFREDKRMSLRSFMLLCVERQMYSSLRHIRRISRQDYLSPLSLDRMIRHTDELYLGDLLAQDSSGEPQQMSRYHDLLQQVYQQLSDHPLDRRVLSLRIQGYTYSETAAILEVSRKDVDNSVQRIRRKIAYLFD